MSVYDELDLQWRHIGSTPAARARLAAWSDAEPVLRPYPTPAEVVGDITAARRSTHSRRLLRALLRASGDPFAARTTLQAMVPGLRAERVIQPCYGHRIDERWATPADTYADLVCATWETIRAHAGETCDDPERLVVRAATRQLRTRRQAHVRAQRRRVPLDPDLHVGTVEMLDAGRTAAEQVTIALADAVRNATLSVEQARLLYATAVVGIDARKAGRLFGLAKPKAVYYALARAEAALVGAPA